MIVDIINFPLYSASSLISFKGDTSIDHKKHPRAPRNELLRFVTFSGQIENVAVIDIKLRSNAKMRKIK